MKVKQWLAIAAILSLIGCTSVISENALKEDRENGYIRKGLVPGKDIYFRVYEDSNAGVMSFNKTLSDFREGEKVLYCERLVDVSYRQNEITGGICIIDGNGQRARVKICNSSMTYRHGMEPAGPGGLSDEELAEFTYENCYGG